jgi:hypothetical protein
MAAQRIPDELLSNRLGHLSYQLRSLGLNKQLEKDYQSYLGSIDLNDKDTIKEQLMDAIMNKDIRFVKWCHDNDIYQY